MKKRVLIVGGVIIAILAGGVTACSLKDKKVSTTIDLSSAQQNELDITDNVWTTDEFLMEEDVESNIDDVVTEVNTDWTTYTAIVNKMYPISSGYVPSDLVIPNVNFSFDFADEKRYLVREAAESLEKLFAAAKYYGYDLLAASGYRSYSRQTSIYNYNLLNKGYDYTNVYSARPGRSEHQTGLAMDITTYEVNKSLTDRFGETEAGIWVAQNSYKYGFIIRYPKGKESITGYAYEPWHLRYVGYDLAKYLYDEGLTLEEYYGCVPNDSFIEREQLSYYDKLLTSNKKQSASNISEAIKDDIVDENQVAPVVSAIPTISPTPGPWERPTATPTVEPGEVVTSEPVVVTEAPVETTQPPVIATTAPPVATAAPTVPPVETENPDNGGGTTGDNDGMQDIF